MVFRVNSMTFRIDPSRFNVMPGYKLRDEYNEFKRWYSENSCEMTQEDAAKGRRLLDQMEEVLSEHDRSKSVKPCMGKDSGKSTQLSFFLSR